MQFAILYFVLLAAAFFVLIVRPQRRRAAAHQSLVRTLAPGDDVITNGGIFGVIRAVDEETVDLEVAPGTVLHVARAAIAQHVPDDLDDTDSDSPELESGD